MSDVMWVVSVMLASVAMALSLAHALEYPGKLRLSRDEYLVVQPIYYPGFTAGGIAEPLAIIATAVLLLLTPAGSRAFWLTLVALVALAVMQAVYWLVTHPVNRVWLERESLNRAGGGFFAADPTGRSREEQGPSDWTTLRDRWENSHVARAILGVIGLTALILTRI